jgi:hypothetical protein
VHLIRNSLDILNRTQQITSMGAGHELRPGRYEVLEVHRLELRVSLALGLPPFENELLALCERDPGGEVGFVVDAGDDELVSGGEVEGLGEVAQELRGGGAEDLGVLERVARGRRVGVPISSGEALMYFAAAA